MLRFFCLIALFLIFFVNCKFTLLNPMLRIGRSSQQKCIHFIHQQTTTFTSQNRSAQENLLALICGKNIQPSPEKHLYTISGLIHLFVVSGSHFLVLEKMTVALKLPIFLRLGLHFLFLFASGFQPPAVRFLIQFLLFKSSWLCRQNYRADQQTLLAGISTLLLFPGWINSLSFLLSWAASLALASCTEVQTRWRRIWLGQCMLFCVLLPLILQIQPPNLLSIPLNLAFGGLLAFGLLPLAALSLFSNEVYWLFSMILQSLHQILSSIFRAEWSRHFLIDLPMQCSTGTLVLWLLILHFGIHLFFVSLIRRRILKHQLEANICSKI